MLTQQKLKELLEYSMETGLWRWLPQPGSWGSKKVGWFRGSINDKGYARIAIKGRLYTAHSLAWLYVYGQSNVKLDHINRNRSDNKIVNLRVATKSQNALNSDLNSNNPSGYTGVRYHKGIHRRKHWHAFIAKDYIQVGKYFSTMEEAVEWRRDKERELFGEFARE